MFKYIKSKFKKRSSIIEVTPPTKVIEPSDIDKLRGTFEGTGDIAVMSMSKFMSLDGRDQQWVREQGKQIIFFPGSMLVNVAKISRR